MQSQMDRLTVDVEIANNRDVENALSAHLDTARFRRNPLRLALVSSQRTGSAGEKRENSSSPRRRPQRFAFRSWGGSASLARSRGCLQRGGGTTARHSP